MGKNIEITTIRNALLRLSCIRNQNFHYDPGGDIFSEGEIHYLIEVSGFYFIVWEDSFTGILTVNPITRFGLDELDEFGAEEAWMVLYVPEDISEGIKFREIGDADLANVYHCMARGYWKNKYSRTSLKFLGLFIEIQIKKDSDFNPSPFK